MILTQRLILRPLRDSDLIALASEINNPRIANNLGRVPWPYRLDDARAFYDRTRNLPPPAAVFALALRPREEPLIGLSGYETHGEETPSNRLLIGDVGNPESFQCIDAAGANVRNGDRYRAPGLRVNRCG
jgi:RimJ/RimL family protein N-acetyltransferase